MRRVRLKLVSSREKEGSAVPSKMAAGSTHTHHMEADLALITSERQSSMLALVYEKLYISASRVGMQDIPE